MIHIYSKISKNRKQTEEFQVIKKAHKKKNALCWSPHRFQLPASKKNKQKQIKCEPYIGPSFSKPKHVQMYP